MKRTISAILAFIIISISAGAQNVTSDNLSLNYKVTDMLTIGGTYANGIGGSVKKIDTGKVGIPITFNTKTHNLTIGSNRIIYKIESQKTDKFEETYIVKGNGAIVGNGGDVQFQIIDSFVDGSINIIISWPDYSSTRYIAKLQKKKDL